MWIAIAKFQVTSAPEVTAAAPVAPYSMPALRNPQWPMLKIASMIPAAESGCDPYDFMPASAAPEIRQVNFQMRAGACTRRKAESGSDIDAIRGAAGAGSIGLQICRLPVDPSRSDAGDVDKRDGKISDPAARTAPRQFLCHHS